MHDDPIRARLDEMADVCAGCSDCCAPDAAAVAALRAVLDLHVEDRSDGYCDTCAVKFPCPTVRTIGDALWVQT